jgi:hypothetical protein
MKKLFLLVIMGGFGCFGSGCTTNVDVDAKKKPDCCKPKSKEVLPLRCKCADNTICNHNPASYGTNFPCKCGKIDCVCTKPSTVCPCKAPNSACTHNTKDYNVASPCFCKSTDCTCTR